ncbi:exonuclease domain-containing protein [Amycolatopsis thermophila]|uniref:DNA polymerase-3 subunit epsilon n=1 Tax=Amycolatopsis thermophila TaxID=206084 RepID=A0ABU0EMW4_9PSEU|nr:exonuclease domain-containing protein [Amycolatopsis thermophila]MDQ0376620.1 DNA polymerase-3 subunit epsilon [Amycolatopsis thermophila]
MGDGWHRGPLVAFDIESSGVEPERDRIVTGTVWSWRPGERAGHETILADPGVEIPAKATAVHGITTEKARTDGIPAVDAVRLLVGMLADQVISGAPLVIYNAPFDLTMLAAECARHGLPTLHELVRDAGSTLYVIDPLVLDRRLDPTRHGKRQLGPACAAYGIELTPEDAHTSAGDCLAAARLAWGIAERFPRIATMPLDALQRFQAAAYRVQAEQADARAKGMHIHRDVHYEWPIRITMPLFTGAA